VSGVGIGKQCAGTRLNYREEQVLASNALAQDVMGYKHNLCESEGLSSSARLRELNSACGHRKNNGF
jgi:hypothetical protein